MSSDNKRVHGVYARLIANDYVGSGVILHCYASDTEQSVAIFSASACGLFGFDSVYLAVNGNESGGTFRLESRHGSVMIAPGAEPCCRSSNFSRYYSSHIWNSATAKGN